jgi:catechol 2,3-dioxygenase-like lactoylglutathione lyase family enzyme
MPGISHISVGVSDVARAKAFYDPLMRILGLHIRQADDESVDDGSPDALSFSLETPVNGQPGAGAPGLRPRYGPTYYGAFLYDLDGNKIEAVTGL